MVGEKKDREMRRGENLRREWLIMFNVVDRFSRKWLCNVVLLIMVKEVVSIDIV